MIFPRLKILSFFLLLAFVLEEQGCVSFQQEKISFKKTTYNHLAGWKQAHLLTILPVFKNSCQALLKKNHNHTLLNGFVIKDMHNVCSQIISFGDNLKEVEFKKYIEDYFTPYKVHYGHNDTGLFTGYYIPILKGSMIKTSFYNIPVYARPKDLVVIEDLSVFRSGHGFKNKRIAGTVQNGRLVPYYTRKDIEEGSIAKKGYELLWVHDPIMLYLMQVQGSGIIDTIQGTKFVLGYDGTNGHEYVSIGKIITQEDKSVKRSQVSLKLIKNWLKHHPEIAKTIMRKNKSYVFFKKMPDNQIVGSQGTGLYPMRSLAVDTAYIPLGLPIWLNIKNKDTPIQTLVISQDTGGAIKGPIRGDLYCGIGNSAEKLAGNLKDLGEYYILIPKSVSLK